MPPQGLVSSRKSYSAPKLNVDWSRYVAGGARVFGVVAVGAAAIIATRYVINKVSQRRNTEGDDDLFSEKHPMPKYAATQSRNAKHAEADRGALEALMRDIGGDGGAEHYLDALWDEEGEEEEEEEYELEFEDSVEYIQRFFGYESLDPELQKVRNKCLKAIDAALYQVKGTELPIRNQFTGQVVDTMADADEEFDDVMSNPDPILQVAAAVEVSLRQRLFYIAKKLGISLGGTDLPAHRTWVVAIPDDLPEANISMEGLLEVAKEYLEICIEIDRTKEQTVEINIEKASAEEGYGEWALRTEAFQRTAAKRRGFMDIEESETEASETDEKPVKKYKGFGGAASSHQRDPLSVAAPTMTLAKDDPESEHEEEEDEEDDMSDDGLEELHDINRRSFEALLMTEIFKRVATEEQQKEYEEVLEAPLNGFIEPYLIGVEEDDDVDSRVEALLREDGGDYENEVLRNLLSRNFEDDDEFDEDDDGDQNDTLRRLLAHNFNADHGDDEYAHAQEDALYEDVGDDWVDY